MTKKAYFYIDDTIWVLRDLTRTRPASLFDVPLLKVLKEAHEKYGVKTQLNLFYRTDYFYGNDEFSLSDVTDRYKKEWESASGWLKLAFHAKQEFPDYPHINATYKDVYDIFKAIEKEVFRFAGENSFTYGTCPHWLPVSKEGVKALCDCGVRLLDATVGETREYDGDPASLPYGHALRLLNNRQPETKVFSRNTRDVAINNSICAYNHIIEEDNEAIYNNFGYVEDEKTGMKFKRLANSSCLNLTPLDELEDELMEKIDAKFHGLGTHEQYFYEDYLAYQPDYADKIYKMGEVLKANGYEFFFAEELV